MRATPRLRLYHSGPVRDGKDTILRPRNFRVAIAYRLGVHVLNQVIPCPLCEQPINLFGDHATCCTKHGDLIVRHNALRNLVDSIATDGKLSPVLEKKGILGDTPGRRPGDVSIPSGLMAKASPLMSLSQAPSLLPRCTSLPHAKLTPSKSMPSMIKVLSTPTTSFLPWSGSPWAPLTKKANLS